MSKLSRSRQLVERDRAAIGSAIYIRFYPMVPEKAKRVTITDSDGREYLDFTSGWAVVNTGYSHPRIVQAVKDQIEKLSYASLTTFTHEKAILLAEKLIEVTPGDFPKKVWFGLSGSDAGDCVYKLLPAYKGRRRLISFHGSVHGFGAMGALFLSGHRLAAKFEGSPWVTKIPYPYCYRCPFGSEYPDCGLACLDFIEKHVFATSSPPDETAAVIVEPVQSDAGDIFPPDNFLPGLKELCGKHGIQFVAAEVLVGYGRTGSLFAIEHDSVVPDVMLLGKPMASGMPLSAVVSRAEILEQTGTHLVTTGGNPVSCAAGLATLEVILEEKLPENAKKVGDYMKKRLVEIAARHLLIGDVRGRGLIMGSELVRDHKSKEPAAKETAKLCYRAWELGLLLHYVGIHSNVVEMTPPLVLNLEEAERGLQIYEKALADVEAGRVSDEKVAPFAGW